VLAFLPIFMMQNITGDFIRSMPLTVIYVLLASLLVSLTLTPNLAYRFVGIAKKVHEAPIRRLLDRLIAGPYRGTLTFGLRHPKTVVLIAVLVFLGSLSLFPVVGVSFFPKAEKPQLMVNINAPDGTSLAQTNNLARQVEEVLAARPEIKHYATNVGHGNPRIYYNVMPRSDASNHSQIFLQLKSDDLETLDRMIRELRTEFENYPGAEITVKEFEQGPPVEAPIAIRIVGKDLDKLKDLAYEVEQIIRATPGSINVNNPLGTAKTNLHVDINRAKAAMLGVPLVEIDRTVRAAVAGMSVAEYHDQRGKKYDIVARMIDAESLTVAGLDRIYVTSVTGAAIPLRQLAQTEFRSSPMRINHYNLNRNVTLTGDVMSGYSVNDVTLQIIEQLEQFDWPKGYRFYVAGELEAREESFGGMGRALIIALVAIFAVLVLQFRSYSQPLIVFAAIPMAIVGSIIALLITGNSFSFTAFVGVSSLVGIVINNSIILVDYTNQLRRDGKGIIEALEESGQTRFVPIILTTMTTVGGLLPLTLIGGTMWAPMGWSIIGGLIASTFLTLLVVPVLYRLFTRG
jgi:multidrug efflux pump subunit AcrB